MMTKKRKKGRKVGKPQEVEGLDYYRHVYNIWGIGWINRSLDSTSKDHFPPKSTLPLTLILYMNFYFSFLFIIRYKNISKVGINLNDKNN